MLVFIFSLSLFANEVPQNVATKDDIKILIEQMDKRFEQIDRRLDFMQNLLYALMGLIFASPFIAIYLRDKKESEDKKNFDQLKATLFVLREMAQDDEKMEKRMKAAGIL